MESSLDINGGKSSNNNIEDIPAGYIVGSTHTKWESPPNQPPYAPFMEHLLAIAKQISQ